MYNKCFGLSLTVSTFLLSRLSLPIVFYLWLHPCCGPFFSSLYHLSSFSLLFVHVLLSFPHPNLLTFPHPSSLYSFYDADSLFQPFPPSKPLFPFPLQAPFLTASLSIAPIYLLLPPSFFFLHMSWYCCCVPDVPQTLFSTIKLLSLPSPAAARITWAEQALLNIEQHREGGTQRERDRNREEGGEEKDREGKAERKKWGNKTNWEEREMEKRQLQSHSKTFIYLRSLNPDSQHWQHFQHLSEVLADLSTVITDGK